MMTIEQFDSLINDFTQMRGSLEAARETAAPDEWVISIGGAAFNVERMDIAAASKAPIFTESYAKTVAPRIRNGLGEIGIAKPYAEFLTDVIAEQAAAIELLQAERAKLS